MGPFRGPYRGSPLRDPCWWAVSTEVAAHWEEVLMGLFRGGTHTSDSKLKARILFEFHSTPIGGHGGVAKPCFASQLISTGQT